MSRLPYYFYKLYHFLYIIKIPILPKVFMFINRIIFGAYIPPSCQIGYGGRFAYGGSGVVIHGKAVIGSRCTIGTGVTIGGRGSHSKEKHPPIIGNNVYISSGAKILGSIVIGNNCIIGANAVVIKDVADNSVVAGVPARVIGINENSEEYYG